MRGIFSTTSATHETAELRTEVARLVPEIIAELGIPSVSVYAADPGAAELVAAKIVEHTAVVGVPPHRTIC